MKEWKIRQQIYSRTWHDHDDLITANDVHYMVYNDDRVIGIVTETYFTQQWIVPIYPAKSYAVAIIYATLLQKYFNEDFLDAVNDPDLLPGDRWFVPYSDKQHIYDQVIAELNNDNLWDFEESRVPQVQATVHYFKKEFSLI